MVKVCSKCGVEKKYSEFHKGRTHKYGIKKQCKSCVKEYYKEYYQENKAKAKKIAIEYQRERRKIDPLYKMKVNLRSRTSVAFKKKGYSKNTKTQEMLGVDWEVVKKHIERKFKKGMNWDNYVKWHIDHIIPLSSAKTSERLKQLCHYTNLQPLWAKDNLSKSNKIIGQQTLLRI